MKFKKQSPEKHKLKNLDVQIEAQNNFKNELEKTCSYN